MRPENEEVFCENVLYFLHLQDRLKLKLSPDPKRCIRFCIRRWTPNQSSLSPTRRKFTNIVDEVGTKCMHCVMVVIILPVSLFVYWKTKYVLSLFSLWLAAVLLGKLTRAHKRPSTHTFRHIDTTLSDLYCIALIILSIRNASSSSVLCSHP